MKDETLVRMAHEIARNLRAQHGDDVVAATVDHLRSFWAPAMRRSLVALVDADRHAFDPIVRDVALLLRSER